MLWPARLIFPGRAKMLSLCPKQYMFVIPIINYNTQHWNYGVLWFTSNLSISTFLGWATRQKLHAQLLSSINYRLEFRTFPCSPTINSTASNSNQTKLTLNVPYLSKLLMNINNIKNLVAGPIKQNKFIKHHHGNSSFFFSLFSNLI